ncbi:MAG: Hsp20/alpha crystallin family protein [Halovenus sp.]
MIREVGESLGSTVVETVGRAVSRAQERRPLPVDLLESDEAFLAVFDAPGVESTDVQVRFENRAILVRIDRFREFHEGFEMQFPGRGLSLDGRVELPDGAAVDPEAATATLRKNGTLHVRLPKVPGEEMDEADGGTEIEHGDGETHDGGESEDSSEDDISSGNDSQEHGE